MTYSAKEIFYTLQGEGANVGRPAVFCRFTGCNFWSGREEDRLTATCQFCDTDIVGIDGPGGGKFATAGALVSAILQKWPATAANKPLVILTGGEPLLQVDTPLIDELHRFGCEIAIETNGSLPAPSNLDWICVSPKAGAEFVQKSGNELKVVFPQDGLELAPMLDLPFQHYFLSPKDGPDRLKNTELCIDYCLKEPRWRLNLQTHKMLGIP
jgi:7-carboxy-7-deazaguanine synthase (Cx14CxxC type)